MIESPLKHDEVMSSLLGLRGMYLYGPAEGDEEEKKYPGATCSGFVYRG